MSWILTAHGNGIDLHYTRPEHMVLADVAHSLAQINRFTGHAQRPYSVAEHSLLVLDIVEHLFAPASVHCRLAALMHDAHEAYIGDISTPLKHTLGETWALVEHRMERALRSAWGLHTAAYEHRDAIKQADLIALATERAQIMPPSPTLWQSLVHIQPVPWVDLMSPERCKMTWRDWRDRFADAVDALDFERNERTFKVAQ
ncbi:MAG: hypothetical protein RJA36_1851 [Pseudomonadota bacterium]|jgi:hypothetical protein